MDTTITTRLSPGRSGLTHDGGRRSGSNTLPGSSDLSMIQSRKISRAFRGNDLFRLTEANSARSGRNSGLTVVVPVLGRLSNRTWSDGTGPSTIEIHEARVRKLLLGAGRIRRQRTVDGVGFADCRREERKMFDQVVVSNSIGE